jgi:FKBP-type peptidyl-prolyl cis-trans isomerase FkpA/FKBP-type peptidyl-prolyl cis-trans isomerase FklB
MRSSLRFPLTALAAASLALVATGCDKFGDKAAKADTAAEAKPGDKAAEAIPGLATEKDQVSYMIGMAMGKQWQPIKDEIDVDMVTKAIKSSFAGEKLLLTDEQAQKISETFGEKMQAKQIAKMLADAKQNAEAGDMFLAGNANKPGVKTTASGLQYQVLTAGEGAKPKPSDTVRVNYKGTLLDGKTFDSSYDRGEPATFSLNQVVPGWQEGIAMMPVGSKYKFWIPAKLGYGDKGTPGGPIPPNATLVFEVELLDIVKQPGK